MIVKASTTHVDLTGGHGSDYSIMFVSLHLAGTVITFKNLPDAERAFKEAWSADISAVRLYKGE